MLGLNIVLWGVVLGAGAWWAIGAFRDWQQTNRTTARFDPPVWAGQNVPGACTGGFYARDADTVVLTIVAHCAEPGARLRDAAGRLIGVFGRRAELADCPEGRFCAPSDFMALALAPDRIPWGHLNVVDMGAGGYRMIAPDARPLSCADVRIGDRAEIDGRERYRSGPVVDIGPYENTTDTIFPCMVVAEIEVAPGDSGSAVLVNGLPAGIVSRQLGEQRELVGFTPLAEGLENLGLTLCTTPDCDLSPETANQPAE